MTTNSQDIPDFDDIVFEKRNKAYGAYILRKNYLHNIFISFLIGIFISVACIITPYLNSKNTGNRLTTRIREVEIKMEKIAEPVDAVVIPPPPPNASLNKQISYIPPVVVDSIGSDETEKLMTSDEAIAAIKNDTFEIKEEVRQDLSDNQTQVEPFLNVEEMPIPNGGKAGLLKYIAENTKYPEQARDNNIQGTVVVKFCVTAKGSIDMVSILKSVDPALDSEALRVIKSLPPFVPGKHQGKPVPVWYISPINFTL